MMILNIVIVIAILAVIAIVAFYYARKLMTDKQLRTAEAKVSQTLLDTKREVLEIKNRAEEDAKQIIQKSKGMIEEETGEAIVLRGQENRSVVILRDDIEQFKATGVSLMPEGLEAQISQQEMADLITFIKEWRYSEAAIPGL